MRQGGAAPRPQQEVTAAILAEPSLAGAWHDVRLTADELLFRRGDTADAFYAVREGEVEVFAEDDGGRRIVLERLGPGTTFGELALLDGGVRAASVRALCATRLGVLQREVFLQAIGTSPDLMELVIGFLGARLRRTVQYVEEVTAWATLVAQGSYDQAEREIEAVGAGSGDPNIARFTGTFREMIAAVRSREEQLADELVHLRIQVDATRRQQEVAEVTATDFFRDLEARARRSRARHLGGASAKPEAVT